MKPPRHPNRPLPTLTQVVQPSALQAAPQVERQQLIDEVMRRVWPKVQTQLQEALQALLTEQLDAALPLLRQDTQTLVSQAVQDALAAGTPPHE